MRKQRSVAIVHQLIVLHAAALVLLAGCQKPPQSGQTIRFTAVSQPAALTKVQYTGDKAGGSKERIDWVQGDAIRIYSSGAKASNDPSYTWADYAVTANGTADGAKSKASISVSSPQGGLTWGSGTNIFYAIYPKPTAPDDAATVRGGTSGTPFNCTVPAAQEGTAISVKDLSNQSGPNINVYYPTNASAYHLAYKSLEEPAAEAALAFEPAYTAFHISAGAGSAPETAKEIKSVTLTSASTALNGAYMAYYNSGWKYDITGTGLATTFTFTGGNYTIPVDGKVEFVIFALPQQLGGLTLTFTLADDTTRSLKLKKNTPDAGTDANGFIKFAPCKKHYIYGLLIPGSVWTVDGSTEVKVKMDENIEPWTNQESHQNYGNATAPIINASKLSGTDPGPYNFSVYAPVGGQWIIRATTDVAGNTPATGLNIHRTNRASGSSDPEDSTGGVLTGTIGAPNPALVEFSLSGASGTYYLFFSVIADGVEYSINSEVARQTGPSQVTI